MWQREREASHMKRFIEGEERSEVTLLPECLDDYVAEGNRFESLTYSSMS